MEKLKKILPPATVIALLIIVWWLVVLKTRSVVFPTPWQVAAGIIELIQNGTLWDHIGASLFRVGAGFLLAVAWAVPLGTVVGMGPTRFRDVKSDLYKCCDRSPRSPGFRSRFCGLASAMHLRSFRSSSRRSFRWSCKPPPVCTRSSGDIYGPVRISAFHVPRCLPRGDPRRTAPDHRGDADRPRRRLARRRGGCARGWDISSSILAMPGNRYDLLIAGMVIIGLIGLLLDDLMRLLEGLKSVQWRYAR